ncbi:MAG: ATP-binding protein [Bacteroidetes bacterium]|nr:ATP-binding protein [Bacteroidota bacterium]
MNKVVINIRNDISELHEIIEVLKELSEKWDLSKKSAMHINLALEEIITNIIFYGFNDKEEHRISIEFIKEKNGVEIIITDDGNPFDLPAAEDFMDKDKTSEIREIGGLGVHFVKTLMDRMSYKRKDEKNILTLYKETV